MIGPALLFCPANRPDRFEKALRAADSVILDLEDAVAPEEKAEARAAVAASHLDPRRVIVRVNPVDSEDHERDVAVLRRTPYRTVMLAKTESPSECDTLHALGCRVVALCETPRGVRNAWTIAEHPAVTALMWGAEDLVAGLGGRSSRRANGDYREVARFARAQVLIAARAAGRTAIDAVHLDISDLDGLESEAEDAAASGFAATACIHPTHVAVIRAAYSPSLKEIAWAQSVLAAEEFSAGVFRLDGRMIDEPILRQARAIMERREMLP
ncbi:MULTISPECIES: HpcH/HpaI aldolase/citrate lyase family protein [unclassified Microbacterium]|uniref:HpcH/HpaI aldolase/citrate lyase family protein n=1 Tax=unclassified Microbacterium TaxID=2609290 RepID=UPI003662DA06